MGLPLLTEAKHDHPSHEPLEPIAVIGMGLPSAGRSRDLESYWDLLVQGRDAIEETPSDRWNFQKFYDPHGVKPGKTQSCWGGYVRDLLEFDPQFFGISPREANSMDPQQRLLLEVTWRALEDGRQKWEELAGKLVSRFCRNLEHRLLGG
ncbi:MAG: beta-ketoacyl synthase N-terminal-like domain-containing protein [Pirellulales bacterium]